MEIFKSIRKLTKVCFENDQKDFWQRNCSNIQNMNFIKI